VAVVLDLLRGNKVGREVHIQSGYGSYDVNRAVKGSLTRQHMAGDAVDIKGDGLTAVDLATVIVGTGVPFDQVIWYDPERGGHVHVSYPATPANRRETLHAPAVGDYVLRTPAAARRV
jgi:hypothetical protein